MREPDVVNESSGAGGKLREMAGRKDAMPESLSRRELFTRWLNPSESFPAPSPTPPQGPAPPEELLPEFLRPPGAAMEERFVSLCERCGKCREACPYDVILPLGPAFGAAEGTPAILPRGGPCRLCDDLPCAAACPTGALKPVPILQVRMGTARLDAAGCWAVMGQPCDYCVKECPLGEAALRFEDGRPRVIEEACAGCGMCAYICTATPPALSILPGSASRAPG